MKPQNKIKIKWSSKFAYAVGLIATDGCLYKDGRHIAFVSKDFQQIKTFMKCLGLKNKIAKKESGFLKGSYSYWVQFGDVVFYKFLVSIGLTPAKSKTMAEIDIPNKYFFDFLRGSFDGDGSLYSYWDKRWASSFLFYLSFTSASLKHLAWLKKTIEKLIGVNGHINTSFNARAYQLKYAKTEAKIIFKKMYRSDNTPRFERKFKKVYNALTIDEENP
jgi:intein-encoded DNA endonuclease-like protein